MAQILVRNLDEAVVRRLKQLAREEGRSLQAEVRTILSEAADVAPAPKRTPRRRKDPTRLLESLRNARLQGPPDWATNADDYIYRGKVARVTTAEES